MQRLDIYISISFCQAKKLIVFYILNDIYLIDILGPFRRTQLERGIPNSRETVHDYT
jgi:hypothetical protein